MTETTATETVNRKLENLPLATQQGKNTFYIFAEDNNINKDTGHGNRSFEIYAKAEFYATTTVPPAPLALDIVDLSDREKSICKLSLSWEMATGSANLIDRYQIYRATSTSSSADLNFVLIDEVKTSSHFDSKLIQGKNYSYKVRVVDNAGAGEHLFSCSDQGSRGLFY